MKNIKLLSIGILLLGGIACTDDLNTTPKVELSLEQLLQQDPNAIGGIMSKLYGSFALSGSNGPGSSDISDDAGESPFLRGIINLEEFTADGMKNRWGDDGLDQLTTASSFTVTTSGNDSQMLFSKPINYSKIFRRQFSFRRVLILELFAISYLSMLWLQLLPRHELGHSNQMFLFSKRKSVR